DRFLEDARVVTFELRADQLDIFRRVEEAIGGAMNRRQPAARVDEVQQRFFLLGRDFRVVRINEHSIVSGELGRGEILQRGGIIEFDATPGEDGLQLFEAIFRTVMAVVAKEEDAEGGLHLRGSDWKTDKAKE